MEWTPANSSQGGRNDIVARPEQLNEECCHGMRYVGDTKQARITLSPNSNGYACIAMPMLSPQTKEHLVHAKRLNHALNYLRPDQAGGPLIALAENSCCATWVGDNGERTTVLYAQGRGQLKLKAGTLIYDGQFDQGFRHGQGTARLFDIDLSELGQYAGAWKWASRDGWGRFTLDSDGTVFEGHWKNDQLNGVVRVTGIDGSVYTGMYRNSNRTGCGRFIWPSGAVEDQLWSGGRLVSKVVYASTAPTLPFLEAFLSAKASALPLPEPPASASASSSPSLVRNSDSAVDALTGPLRLPDKMLARAIDVTHARAAATAIAAALGVATIAVTVDWPSIEASGCPRKSAYTLDFNSSAYILQPLAGAFLSAADEPANKTALAERVKTIVLRQSATATRTTVEFVDDQVIILSNFEFGRGSTLFADDIADKLNAVHGVVSEEAQQLQAIKKAERDAAAAKTASLEKLSAAVGAPVTFNWDLEANFRALDGNSSQTSLADGVLHHYLPAVVAALVRASKDELVKTLLMQVWTTRNLTFTVTAQDSVEPEKALATWGGFNGLRLIDGTLDIFVWPSTFFAQVPLLEAIDFTKLLANAKGDLPLGIMRQIRDSAEQRTKLLDRIVKATGVDSLTWDIAADAKAIIERGDKKYEFAVRPAVQYMEALASLLEKKCDDALIKDSVKGALGARAVSFRVVDDLAAVGGQEMHTSYNGIAIQDGKLVVLTQADQWWTNVSQIEGYDLVKLF